MSKYTKIANFYGQTDEWTDPKYGKALLFECKLSNIKEPLSLSAHALLRVFGVQFRRKNQTLLDIIEISYQISKGINRWSIN